MSDFNSILFNENTFYKQFIQDLLEAKKEVIIESPYITIKRLDMLRPSFERLVAKGIKIFIITRDPLEHDRIMVEQSERGIQYFVRGWVPKSYLLEADIIEN